MKLKDFNLENIKNYFEGNLGLLKSKLNLEPLHIKEQIVYRALHCPPSCQRTGTCHYCGCDRDGKLYVHKSCNRGLTLPDIMDEESWKQYKKKQIENDKKNFELP